MNKENKNRNENCKFKEESVKDINEKQKTDKKTKDKVEKTGPGRRCIILLKIKLE